MSHMQLSYIKRGFGLVANDKRHFLADSHVLLYLLLIYSYLNRKKTVLFKAQHSLELEQKFIFLFVFIYLTD